MTTILAIIFAVATVVCGIGWLQNKIAARAVILYLLAKENTPPTEAEMEACCKEAIRRMFGLKS